MYTKKAAQMLLRHRHRHKHCVLERQYSLLKTTGVGLGLEGAGLGSTLASDFPHNYTHRLEEMQAVVPVTCWYYT